MENLMIARIEKHKELIKRIEEEAKKKREVSYKL